MTIVLHVKRNMCILDWPRYVKGCIHGKISEYMACIFLKLIGKHLVPYLWFKMIWFDHLMKRFQFDVVRISVWSGKDLCFFFTTGIIYVGLIEVIFYSELQLRLCCVEVELWFWQQTEAEEGFISCDILTKPSGGASDSFDYIPVFLRYSI